MEKKKKRSKSALPRAMTEDGRGQGPSSPGRGDSISVWGEGGGEGGQGDSEGIEEMKFKPKRQHFPSLGSARWFGFTFF